MLEALLMDGSVTRAAPRLRVTQSAVSHALRKLRAFFDVPFEVPVLRIQGPPRSRPGPNE